MDNISLEPLVEGDVIFVDIGMEILSRVETKFYLPYIEEFGEEERSRKSYQRSISSILDRMDREIVTNKKMTGMYVVEASKSYQCIFCRKLADNGNYDPDGRTLSFAQDGLQPRPKIYKKMMKFFV